MQKTWLVWLGVLVVVVIIVVVVASRGGKAEPEGGTQTQTRTGQQVSPRGMFQTDYATIVRRLSEAKDEAGKQATVGQLGRFRAVGLGWVSEVEELPEGGVVVHVDVDAPGTKADGAEVMVAIATASAEEMPTAGTKVNYNGRIANIVPDAHVIVELTEGRVTPAK